MNRQSPITLTLLLVIGGLVPSSAGKNQWIRDEAPPVDQLVNVPMAIVDFEPGTKITAAHLASSLRYRSKVKPDQIKP